MYMYTHIYIYICVCVYACNVRYCRNPPENVPSGYNMHGTSRQILNSTCDPKPYKVVRGESKRRFRDILYMLTLCKGSNRMCKMGLEKLSE